MEYVDLFDGWRPDTQALYGNLENLKMRRAGETDGVEGDWSMRLSVFAGRTAQTVPDIVPPKTHGRFGGLEFPFQPRDDPGKLRDDAAARLTWHDEHSKSSACYARATSSCKGRRACPVACTGSLIQSSG